MATRIGGMRRKTRHKLHKEIRAKGKVSQRRYLQVLQSGDRVSLVAEPAVQTGMYHPRFHGLHGVVHGKAGSCYTVEIDNMGKSKLLIVHPVHLVKN